MMIVLMKIMKMTTALMLVPIIEERAVAKIVIEFTAIIAMHIAAVEEKLPGMEAIASVTMSMKTVAMMSIYMKMISIKSRTQHQKSFLLLHSNMQ